MPFSELPCSVEWTTFDSMDLRTESGMMVKMNGILTKNIIRVVLVKAASVIPTMVVKMPI